MHRSLPIDIAGIIQTGVGTWRDSFFWPVDDVHYEDFCHKSWDAFLSTYSQAGPECRDILLADVPFFYFMIYHAHAQAVSAWTRANGVTLAGGEIAKQFYDPDWEALGSAIARGIRGGKGFPRLRHLAKNVVYNSDTIRKGGLPLHRAVMVGSMTHMASAYAVSENLLISHYSYERLFGAISLQNAFLESPEIRASLTGIVVAVRDLCRELFQFDLETGSLRRAYEQRAAHLLALLRTGFRGTSRPERLLAANVSYPLTKIAATLFRQMGSEVVGLHHGTIGAPLPFHFGCNGYSSCDTFACPTSGSASCFSERYEQTPISRHHPVTFFSTESRQFLKRCQRAARLAAPDKIRSVMVLGFPMNALRYQGLARYFFPYQLDLEIRIAQVLRQLGYRSIYKCHPERASLTPGLMTRYYDHVETAPLESLRDLPDAFVVKYTASGAFAEALCTNRPVVLLDLDKRYWPSRVWDALLTRCSPVALTYDERERALFDEDAFAHALRTPFSGQDDYRPAYLFPTDSQG